MSYLFFSLATILFFEKYIENNNTNKLYLWMGGITLILALYTKMVGWSLVIASLLYFFINKKHREFWLIGGISFFCFLPWIIRNILVSDLPMEYITSIVSGYKTCSLNIAKSIIFNTISYGNAIKYILLPGCFLHKLSWELLSAFSLLTKCNYVSFPFPLVLSIFLVGILLFGFYFKIRQKFSLLESYVICYLLVLLICPPDFFLSDGKRYLYQILPFLSYYFLSGLFEISREIKFLHFMVKKTIILSLVLIVLIPNLMCSLCLIKGNINYLVNYKNLSKEEKKDYYASWFNVYFTSALWIKEKFPLDVRIMHHFLILFIFIVDIKQLGFF
jgi:hypothetical protein